MHLITVYFQTSNSENAKEPHVQFDLHVIGSGAEDEANSADKEVVPEKPKEKKKLIEEMD
jgi:hypothetical protein